MKNCPVALNRCTTYDTDKITELLSAQFEAAGITKELIFGKTVVIKPNLVMNKAPEFAATTHPTVLAAAARVLKELGAASITVAESPGGPYTEGSIKAHFNGCGITEAAEAEGIRLFTKASWKQLSNKDAKRCKSFNIIDPISEADVIVNICKLKTHSLTKMSAGIKNFFGTVPGVEKFELHARFPKQEDFVEMICDLCETLSLKAKLITVCDGIIGMEGNGPTGGTPKEFGVLLTSLSPYSLDTVCESILSFEGTVPMLNAARVRGLCPQSIDEVEVIGDSVEACKVNEVILPDTQKFNILRSLPDLFGGRLARIFEPKPKITKKTCIGCGVCARSCPQKTIIIKNKKAKINYKSCIRCYCCQELCPINSVSIKQNIFIKLIH